MSRRSLLLCVCVGLCGSTVTYTQTSAVPAFEVASVKPNAERRGIRWNRFPADRFEATNVPARDLILIAYGDAGQILPEIQMSGGPRWIDEDRFDVIAKVGADHPSTVAQKQLMLRT